MRIPVPFGTIRWPDDPHEEYLTASGSSPRPSTRNATLGRRAAGRSGSHCNCRSFR